VPVVLIGFALQQTCSWDHCRLR